MTKNGDSAQKQTVPVQNQENVFAVPGADEMLKSTDTTLLLPMIGVDQVIKTQSYKLVAFALPRLLRDRRCQPARTQASNERNIPLYTTLMDLSY